MRKLVRTIAIVDSQGVELTLYEYRESRRERLFGLFDRTVETPSLLLDTGEAVEVDGDGFVIRETGERLTKADD